MIQEEMQKRIESWLEDAYDPQTRAEIRRLLQQEPHSLVDAFYRDLMFGTGGMRGIMGIGTNRMNVYTVRAATQGFANYLLKQPHCEKRGIFIGYDVRINSRLFAEEAARVLAGNGIEALLTEEICPTPLASFGCRHYGCLGAIMITASHNPPQYNGYKVYWQDGGQVVAPHDEAIMAEVKRVQRPADIVVAPKESPLIHKIGREIDEAYLQRLQKKPLKGSIVYSNLHGTGIRLAPEALRRAGFTVRLVEEQAPLDGQFCQAPSPNPEEEKALALGSELLLKVGADLFLANDPDADRIGAVVRDKGKAVRLNGHEIAVLCLMHIASQLKAQGALPPNGAAIKTIVTTDLFRKIAASFHIQCFDVLTGFKFIAELIRTWEESFEGLQFLFGAEESHGYLASTFVRDKDGIAACCLLAEAAARAKEHNLTLIDQLYEIYRIHGVHRQRLVNLAFSDSPEGMQKMAQLTQRLRSEPPHTIAKRRVVRLDDYRGRISYDLTRGLSSPLFLAVSDVLHFTLEDKSSLIIRPSGTEPKIKIYCEYSEAPSEDVDGAIRQCDTKLQELIHGFQEEMHL